MWLSNCQIRNAEALDSSYNMSLSSTNVKLQLARDCGYEKLPIGYIKMLMHNAYARTIYFYFREIPETAKNGIDFKELLFLSIRDAAWTFLI